MVNVKILSRNLIIIALLIALITISFKSIQVNKEHDLLLNQKLELQRKVMDREAAIYNMRSQKEKLNAQVHKMIIDRKNLIKDYDSIIANINKHEVHYIIPVLPDDSLRQYFANYKYQSAR